MTIFKIHILYWLMTIICVFTGYFKPFLYFSLLIIIHEIGHLTGAIIYKWKIQKVIILPFGGITIFNEYISKSLFEEFIILIMGPLFQIIFYFSYTKIFGFNNLLFSYHYTLLFFNLLPIYPLDGYKLMNLFFNKILSFKTSHLLTMIISNITVILILTITIIYKFNLIMLIALIFLLYKNVEEISKHEFIFNKFLLERYLYNINLKKTKIIKSNNPKKMKREYKHLFYYNQKYETEKSFLKKKFDFKTKIC